jgi:hypothetical protein
MKETDNFKVRWNTGDEVLFLLSFGYPRLEI